MPGRSPLVRDHPRKSAVNKHCKIYEKSTSPHYTALNELKHTLSHTHTHTHFAIYGEKRIHRLFSQGVYIIYLFRPCARGVESTGRVLEKAASQRRCRPSLLSEKKVCTWRRERQREGRRRLAISAGEFHQGHTSHSRGSPIQSRCRRRYAPG